LKTDYAPTRQASLVDSSATRSIGDGVFEGPPGYGKLRSGDIIHGIFAVPAVYERFGLVPTVYERLALKTAETVGLVKFAERRGKE
jgi:hypothetical protein